MGLTDFSKLRKNKGACHQSCQRLSILTPNIDGEVTKWKRAGNFLIQTDVFISYARWCDCCSVSQTMIHSYVEVSVYMALVVVVAVDDFVRAREQRQVIICYARSTIFRSLRTVPTKSKGLFARLGPCGKSRFK